MLCHEVESNQKAWEYRVYEWRMQFQGMPQAVAKQIVANPRLFLRYHADLFDDLTNKRVASICGSDGRRAVAMAVMGAIPTVFDLSEPQKQYALELAYAASVHICYEVGDFCSLNKRMYADFFDIAYAEGGILHYFHDLSKFFATVYSIISPEGLFVLSDYHPFQKNLYS